MYLNIPVLHHHRRVTLSIQPVLDDLDKTEKTSHCIVLRVLCQHLILAIQYRILVRIRQLGEADPGELVKGRTDNARYWKLVARVALGHHVPLGVNRPAQNVGDARRFDDYKFKVELSTNDCRPFFDSTLTYKLPLLKNLLLLCGFGYF